jgi:DNA-directed RNA polymerase specialized sigma54-like protein
VSAFESVVKHVKSWQPKPLPTELKYRDSLIAHLRGQLKEATTEPEYRHCGTTADIYVKEKGFFGSSEVFVEMKRNLTSKSQLDRLVGQIESLQPKKNFIIVVLCGETNPALLSRLKERYEAGQQYRVLIDPCVEVVVKQDGRNA